MLPEGSIYPPWDLTAVISTLTMSPTGEPSNIMILTARLGIEVGIITEIDQNVDPSRVSIRLLRNEQEIDRMIAQVVSRVHYRLMITLGLEKGLVTRRTCSPFGISDVDSKKFLS